MAGFLGLDTSCLRVATLTERSSSCACDGICVSSSAYRDLVEMMADRGSSLAHTTIMRWVHHYTPEFERRWNRFLLPPGRIFRGVSMRPSSRSAGKWVCFWTGRSTARAQNRGLPPEP